MIGARGLIRDLTHNSARQQPGTILAKLIEIRGIYRIPPVAVVDMLIGR